MDIGTAKPTKIEQEMVPHHLIDVLVPDRFFSVAEYKMTATCAIDDIVQRGKVPIICGGTGLYARALLEGIDIPSVPPQPELRQKLNCEANEKGNAYLLGQLKELDPLAAQRLNSNDRIRIIRALEVSLVSGKPFSSLAGKSEPLYDTHWIGLCMQDRALHKEMIAKRLAEQIAAGLVEEMRELWAKPPFQAVLRSAINYKEFIPCIEGKESLEAVESQCLLHNFQLARKQMIWFKANDKIQWFAMDEMDQDKIFAQIIESMRNYSIRSM